MRNSTFIENHSPQGGAVFCDDPSSLTLAACTLHRNYADMAGGGVFCAGASVDVDHTIIAFCLQGEAIFSSDVVPVLNCCDLFGNAGGDWIGDISDQNGQRGNISQDPLFCDPSGDELTLRLGSPCVSCSDSGHPALIGAWGVGCGSTPAQETTWGAMKALFRGDGQ